MRNLTASALVLALALAGCAPTSTSSHGPAPTSTSATLGGASDDVPAPPSDDRTTALWALTSSAGSITASGSGYLLTLVDVRPFVTEFTDRPVRAAWMLPLTTLARNWTHLFTGDPPNAALTALQARSTEPQSLVIVLGTPRYAPKSRVMQIPIGLVGTDPRMSLADRPLHDLSLFIDASPLLSATTATPPAPRPPASSQDLETAFAQARAAVAKAQATSAGNRQALSQALALQSGQAPTLESASAELAAEQQAVTAADTAASAGAGAQLQVLPTAQQTALAGPDAVGTAVLSLLRNQ